MPVLLGGRPRVYTRGPLAAWALTDVQADEIRRGLAAGMRGDGGRVRSRVRRAQGQVDREARRHRWAATSDQTASTTPNGQAPCRKP